MNETFFNQYFPLFFASTWIWLAFVLAASIVIRRRRGKSIFAHSPRDCVFEENRISGRELSGIRALGGASNALKVCVTKDTLVIMPNFPFSLMFMPDVWGLDYAIPLQDITRLEEKSGFLGARLILHFGKDRRIELRLRNPDGFKRAIAAP